MRTRAPNSESSQAAYADGLMMADLRMPGRSPMSEDDYETTLRLGAEDTPWDRLRTSDFGPTCGDRPLIFGLCISAWAEDDLAIGFGHRTSARHAATDH